MRPLLLFALLGGLYPIAAQTTLDSLIAGISVQSPSIPIEVGYGRQDLRHFNGAVTHLEARQFNQGQIYDWNQLWQAQVPGFTVTRPGSNPNENFDARIRGLHTLGSGSTKPLYVVDGVPGVDIFAVDPSDIVAVDILRDVASTAIYGGRGAGGVVLITTKPNETGLKVKYQGQVSLESAAKRFTLLDETEYLANGGTDLSPLTVQNTDWQEEILRTAVGHAHHLSASKGTAHGFIRGGLHYRDVTGISRESSFEQYNGSLLASQRFWHDRLTLTAGGSLGQRQANYGFNEGYRYAITYNPSSPIRSDDSQYIPYGGYVENTGFDVFNPVALIEQNHNSGRTDFHLLHAGANLQVLPNLTAGLQVSEQVNAVHNLEYYSPYAKFRGAGVQGSGLTTSEKNIQKNLESTLTYRFRTAHWQGELLGGYGWYHAQVNTSNTSGAKLPDQSWQGKTWQQYQTMLKEFYLPGFSYDVDSRSDRLLVAFFGRGQVQWRNTYFGTFSWRKEGSSNLAPATRWGVFPAFSLGLDINQWMAARPFDYFKLSVGHGVVGTEITRSGLYQTPFGQGPKFYYNGQFVPSYGIYKNPNDRLGWERTTENSLNLNFSMWSGRLQGSANWYWYRSRNLIMSVTKSVPPNFSANSIENVGETAGHGTELSLNYELVKNQYFRWEIGVAATTAVTTLEQFGYSNYDTIKSGLPGAPCGCSVYLQVLYPGAQIGTFWGPVVAGIDANGYQTFEDLDGDGRVEEDDFNLDQTYLGNAQPTWQLGLSQKLTWRKLDLNVLVQAITGHKLVNYYRNAYGSSNYPSVWNHVITPTWDPTLQFTRFNNQMVEDASFLRLQYVSLGYRLALRNKWMHSLHFQIGAQNLFTLSKYTGLDPDLRLLDKGPSDNGGRAAEASNPLSPGIDRGGTYPTARRWWLGVEAEF